MHSVVFIFLICFSLSNPHRKKLEEKKLLRLGSNALRFSFRRVNICVIICRTPKATVKWSQHKISWMDPGHRKTTIKILSTLLWQYSKLELWIKHLYRNIPPIIQVWNIAVVYIYTQYSCTCCVGGEKVSGDTATRVVLGSCSSPSCEQGVPDATLCSCVYPSSTLLSLQSLAFSQPRPCPWKIPAGLTSNYLFWAIYSTPPREHKCNRYVRQYFEEWLWFLFAFMLVQ